MSNSRTSHDNLMNVTFYDAEDLDMNYYRKNSQVTTNKALRIKLTKI